MSGTVKSDSFGSGTFSAQRSKQRLVRVEKLTAAEAAAELPALTDLLLDAVDRGASIGFLPPPETSDARQYWNEVMHAIDGGNRILKTKEIPRLCRGGRRSLMAPKVWFWHRIVLRRAIAASRKR